MLIISGRSVQGISGTDTLEILYVLFCEKRASAWRMRKVLIPGPEALAKALLTLAALGLIECEVVHRFPFGRVYRLTDRGTALAMSIYSWFPQMVR